MINLENFPDEIYFKIKRGYKNKIFENIKLKKIELIKLLNITYSTLNEWKKAESYLSLGTIKKLMKLSEKQDFEELKNNILSYKTERGLEVKNPKIPILDSLELREIVIHIMCDGCFSSGYAAYYNVDKATKEEFIEELNKTFGEVEYYLDKDYVHFPSAIALILKRFFKIEFHSKICRLPQEFFNGTREKLRGIIRAMIIDEGTIDGSNVRLDSCNKRFLEDMKKIGERIGIKFGEMWQSITREHKIFRINISAKSLRDIKEMKKLPQNKKQVLLDIALKNHEKEWKYKLPGEVKKEIILALLEKPLTSFELIEKLQCSKSSLGGHIRKLINKKIITHEFKDNKRHYIINNKDYAEKFLKDPSEFIDTYKLKNYGLSQLKILKILEREELPYMKLKAKLKIGPNSFFKTIRSLKNKRFIERIDKKWYLTDSGRSILNLKEDYARYCLYANIKNI
jgi:DNA-binding transcriptional regulator GbsR (MarR family)